MRKPVANLMETLEQGDHAYKRFSSQALRKPSASEAKRFGSQALRKPSASEAKRFGSNDWF